MKRLSLKLLMLATAVFVFENSNAQINDDCSGAISITPSIWGEPAWETFPLGGNESLSGCAGDADDDIWFSFTANSANDVVIAQDPTGGYDAVVEVFDGCGGASLGCFDNYDPGEIERALPGGLIPGVLYYFRVFDAATGVSASTDVRVMVKTFEDSQLRNPSCGATELMLNQVIYSENDMAGQLYSNPQVWVTGYAFRFQEQGGGLDVTIERPVTNGWYFHLVNAGLEYGKSYDVTVSHRVTMSANGSIDPYWSQFGTVCGISMAATVPATQLRAEYCTGGDYFLSSQLQAEVVIGASDYRFTFVPTGPFNTLVEETANYAVNLNNVGSVGNRLQAGVSYTVTVEARVNGNWSAPGASCEITLADQPEDTEVRASYCGGTYSFPSSQFILAESVVGATAYEFKFSPQPSGTVLTKVVNTVSFGFGQASLPFSAGTTYNVQVRAYWGAVSGDYVDTGCQITVIDPPTTNLRPQYCLGQDYFLSDQVQAEVVETASNYRFTFVPASPFNTLVYVSANYAANLNVVGSSGNRLQAGVSYTVTVEAFAYGQWSAPGSDCQIVMSSQPEDTEVRASFCGGTYTYPSSNSILAQSVVGATAYEFEFSPLPSGTVLTKVVGTVSFGFGPASLPFVAGTTYNAQVRAYWGSAVGDYVDTGCLITVDGPPMMDQESMTSNEEAKAGDLIATSDYSLFPNPNDGTEFMVQRLNGAFNEGAIGIEILDITGKSLQSEMRAVKGDSRVLVNPAKDLSKGMYLLRITDEKGTQTLRFTVD